MYTWLQDAHFADLHSNPLMHHQHAPILLCSPELGPQSFRLQITLQVPRLCYARALTRTDMQSALVSPDDNADSVASLDALQPGASDSSMYTVQNWLASNKATWSSILPQHMATPQGASAALDEDHMRAEANEQHAEEAAPLLPVGVERLGRAVAPMQPSSLDQSTVAELHQHTMVQPADQQCVAEAATKRVPAGEAQQQHAVQALVQRFEHMTAAKRKTSKQGATGPRLLGSSVDQPQDSTSARRVHWMYDTAAEVQMLEDAKSSTTHASARLGASREVQPSINTATLQGRSDSLIDWPLSAQPSEWLLNTAFEPGNSAVDLEADASATRYAVPAASDAAVPVCNLSQLCIEGPAGIVHPKRAPVQDSSWPVPRYALNVQHC